MKPTSDPGIGWRGRMIAVAVVFAIIYTVLAIAAAVGVGAIWVAR